MVIAIGPQKMLRASGIMPRIAANAMSNTGRARRTVASMMARYGAHGISALHPGGRSG